jgi:predicted PurR-regulated permease PerM
LEAYADGTVRLKKIITAVTAQLGDRLPEEYVERLFENAVAYIGGFVLNLLNSTTSALTSLLIGAVVTGLYIVFWLCSPLHFSKDTEDVIQRYIMLKSLVCLLYGASTLVLFMLLGVDLPEFFGLTSFILNYIPEFGPIIAMILPLPVILLDSRLPDPLHTLALALIGQLLLKAFWSNVVEVKLIERDAHMTMHPVITLLSIAAFGSVWGPTGMMLSVPLMGLLKLAVASSDTVPLAYRLALFRALGDEKFEGRLNSPNQPFSDLDHDYTDTETSARNSPRFS